ncbi:MAG: hypothetical protein K2J47_08985 [Ruminococcus sp.]|nr:hypothetical protein [Ruminococcus sp.]
MQTIIIKLDSRKLENPVTDIPYELSENLESYSGHKITDNGYDYLSDFHEMGIWFSAGNAEESYSTVIDYIKSNHVCGNDLSLSAEIFISENECDDLENCRKVY